MAPTLLFRIYMPSRKPFTDPTGPFHIGARSINKEWFKLSMNEVWDVFSNHLYFAAHAFQFQIHAFVLMNNHYHLMVSTPLGNLSDGMAYFHREVSRELNRRGNRINRTFAGRFFSTELKNYHYFLNCYKYLYQNPIRAHKASDCESYPFSTLHGLLGQSQMLIPVLTDPLLFDGHLKENLNWLNRTPAKEDIEAIRRALKRKVFQLPKDPSSRKMNRLETELL